MTHLEGGSVTKVGGFARAVALVASAVLYLAFWGLAETSVGLAVGFFPPLTNSTPGELMFWLGHSLLVIPASVLAGFAVSPWLGGVLAEVERRLLGWNRRELAAGCLAVTALYFAAARLGHEVVLRGYPVTDDEYAVRFGGQIMALGKLQVTAPEPAAAFPNLYLFFRDGWVTSIDWVGVQVAWAIAEATGLGVLVFALAAALAAGAVAWLLQRRLGGIWGLVAFLLFLFSPMATMLSVSTHAHVLSRAAVALALVLYSLAADSQRRGHWFLVGAAAGLGFCCRPVETGLLLSPLLADALWQLARTDGRGRRNAAALCLGGLVFVSLFALHNWAITGSPLVQARFADGAVVSTMASGSLWHRFGSNAGYSLFLLLIWFLGPLGWLAAIGMRDRLTTLLGVGVVADLAFSCFHDFPGIHAIGPIHYSEVAVPLVVLAVHGLARVRSGMAAAGMRFRTAGAVLATTLVLGMGTFVVHHAQALRQQALPQSYFYAAIESGVADSTEGAVVLAPQFGATWTSTPLGEIGSWVFEWRRARPDFRDRVLILHDAPGVELALRRQFPERAFYRFRPTRQPPYFRLTALAPSPRQGAGD